jgi:3-deoxy-D-manno-octulosonic-acid transferase
MLYWIYNGLATLALVVGVLALPVLALIGRRFRRALPERFGFYPRGVRDAIAGARPLWLHAASVGEVIAAKGLIADLKARFPSHKILLSTFTATGRDVAEQSAGADACILLPLDHPWIVRRALAKIDPVMLVLLETELWPNLLRLCHARGVPTLLLSGRLSIGSFRRYFFLRPFFSRIVGRLTAVGMQTEEDADRIRRLGADPRRVSITGNLKRATQPHTHAIGSRGAGRTFKNSGAAVIVAGSTHRGEDEVLIEAFRELKKKFPGLMMVLAPRHPQRFADVERLLKSSGLRYMKRTEMNGVPPAEILFLDTMGELAEFYAMADLAFVGGSLVAAGGHNVLEPARCRKPVLFGPYTANFSHIVDQLKRSGGGIEVADKDDFVRQAARLLSDPAEAKKIGERAYDIARTDRQVVDASLDLVSRYF